MGVGPATDCCGLKFHWEAAAIVSRSLVQRKPVTLDTFWSALSRPKGHKSQLSLLFIDRRGTSSLPADTIVSLVLVNVHRDLFLKDSRKSFNTKTHVDVWFTLLNVIPRSQNPPTPPSKLKTTKKKPSENIKESSGAAGAPTGRHNKSPDVLICCLVSNVTRFSGTCAFTEREERA